ncbi:MAG: helix-turn-helix transcriptional regulator [Muribaculaceae bacterium]|jgi:plasmid maintenance system antidote protein VapI|nr:helix-turn-helix transcriptional regulator [Muribaculaceae bacterium]
MESSAETPIIQRLNEFIRYTGLSSTQFADKAGIPRPTLSQMVHGRNKSVNNQMLAKLNENFPELNILWFLFGQGTMLLDNRSPLAGSETSGSEVHEVVDNEFVNALEQSVSASSNEASEANKMSAEEEFVENGGRWDASVLCTPPASVSGNEAKKIKSIIVFYSDNSFETFMPC